MDYGTVLLMVNEPNLRVRCLIGGAVINGTVDMIEYLLNVC